MLTVGNAAATNNACFQCFHVSFPFVAEHFRRVFRQAAGSCRNTKAPITMRLLNGLPGFIRLIDHFLKSFLFEFFVFGKELFHGYIASYRIGFQGFHLRTQICVIFTVCIRGENGRHSNTVFLVLFRTDGKLLATESISSKVAPLVNTCT